MPARCCFSSRSGESDRAPAASPPSASSSSMRSVRRLLDWRILLPLGAVILIGAGAGVYWYNSHRNAGLAMALTGGAPSRAPWLMTRYGCAGCHTIGGVPGADGQVGPPLKGLIER